MHKPLILITILPILALSYNETAYRVRESCANVPHLARNHNFSSCFFERNGVHLNNLSSIRCETIGGYNQIAGSYYTSLSHQAATYTLLENERTPDGGWCLFQVRYAQFKVESRRGIHSNVTVHNDDDTLPTLDEETRHLQLSDGLKRLEIAFNPETFGPLGFLDADPNCSSCQVNVPVLVSTSSMERLRLSFNGARKMSVEFNPAFIEMASSLLAFFDESSVLQELVVSGGEAWGKPGVILPHLHDLKVLNLSRNGLVEFDDENFLRVPSLEGLSLAGNCFQEVPQGIATLKKLSQFDFSGNSASPARLPEVLPPLVGLQWLNLSGVQLEGLEPLAPALSPKNISQPCAHLLGLDISFCKLQSLDTDVARRIFLHQTALQFLSLAGNAVSYIPPGLFERLSDLRELNLAAMSLLAGPELLLTPHRQLGLLDLSRNMLTSPSGVIKQGAVDLLDLSRNLLMQWTEETAFHTSRHVNLSYTGIEELTTPMLRSLDPMCVVFVDLGGNPLDCWACSIPELQEWLISRGNSSVLNLGLPHTLTCRKPLQMTGSPVLEAPNTLSPQCREASFEASTVIIAAVLGTLLLSFLILGGMCYWFRYEIIYMVNLLKINRAIAAKEGNSHIKYDAFVCYSGCDRAWVLGKLLPELERGANAYKLCFHERDFILGSFISHNIVRCIHTSRHTLVVLTKNLVQSQWCLWELDLAAHKLLEGARDFLILIELEKLDRNCLPRYLKLFMNTRTFLQWPARGQDEDEAWQRLRKALGPSIASQMTINNCVAESGISIS